MICAAVERCAGIDVHKKFLAVCIMVGPLQGNVRVEQRRYGTTKAQLCRLRAWLEEEQITHVAMESTGSYWKPVFNVLEEAVKVLLANPLEVKNRKGHKTDKKDGWWLAHLLRHAMIHASFIPARAIRDLRDMTRRRKRLLGDAVSEKNRIQKVLEDANVKLGNVLSDVFGSSGQEMLEALLEGKATAEEIAQMAKCQARKKIPEIAEALEGHQMRDHHRKLIQSSLRHMAFLEEEIVLLDADIEAQIKEAGLTQAWELIQSVPGIRDTSAAAIVAETGADMDQFPSAGHLSSWAGLCPGNNETGGKKRSSRTTKGNPWLRGTLTECAWAASSKKGCFLKEKRRNLTAKNKGKAQPALVAVAHTMLLLIYNVLKTSKPYQERELPPLEGHKKERIIRHHIRRLGKLGIPVYRTYTTIVKEGGVSASKA